MRHAIATEHDEQSAIFEYAEYRANQDARWSLLYAVPNGQYRPGQRMEAGLRKGVPDIALPVPMGRYAGFYGELKVGRNKATPEQEWWLARLAEQGYYVTVQRGAEQMIAELERYLSQGRRAIEVQE